MGRQVEFYMARSDEAAFIEFARSDGTVKVFQSVLPTESIPDLDQMPVQGEPYWFSLCLWDMDSCLPPVLNYVDEQNCYVVDLLESEVIEFHRCVVKGGTIGVGRIWAEMNGSRKDRPADVFEKGSEFRRWYDRLASWIKRRGRRKGFGEYVLPDAQKLQNQGGYLSRSVTADADKV